MAIAAALQAACGVAVVVHRSSASQLAVGAIPGSRLAGPPVSVGHAARVQGELPVALDMPAIEVATSLVRLGLAGDGSLEVPGDFGVAGWWSGGSAPGEAGPAIVVGHLDSYRGAAVFFRLRQLLPGDPVFVGRSDGSVVKFEVERVEQFAKDEFPTDAIYGATSEPTLRLITCGGSFNKSRHSYDDNVVAFARLASSVGSPAA